MHNLNPMFLTDFYKIGHHEMEPEGIEFGWANYTPRYNYDKTADPVVFFGLQYFIKEYLIKTWNEQFFDRPLKEVLDEYTRVISKTLRNTPRTDHVEALHKLGYLPIAIYALPEGTLCPINVPVLVVVNTIPGEFVWLSTFIETVLSTTLWMGITSATKARKYHQLFTKYAKAAGEKDLSYIDWQGHDFSFRGMSGVEAAIISGMGHLTSFSGTDTIPAILKAEEYYKADISQFGSVPASEHAIQMACGEDKEFETLERLITQVYPAGVYSNVSDTWDLWRVLTNYMPRLKGKIMARDGVLVVRPDSGDPVKIICGNDDFVHTSGEHYNMVTHPAYHGVMDLLRSNFPVTDNGAGYDVLSKVASIYGDSITLDRADRILSGLLAKRFSPRNMVFGIGSFTYQFVTRDNHGQAMKRTAVKYKGGPVIAVYKSPITDDGGKKSARGIPVVYPCPERGLKLVESLNPYDLDDCSFRKVFSNGNLRVDQTFDEIRKRVRA